MFLLSPALEPRPPRANTFGKIVGVVSPEDSNVTPEDILDSEAVPDRDSVETLDVRELPPPKPLTETIEALEGLNGGILVQVNDRTPQHLFPKLTDRGYDYESAGDGPVYTAIWQAD